MCLLITVVLMGTFNFVICDPLTHTYEEYCKPPYGYRDGDANYTTPLYKEIKPIERCCPACEECVDIGGHCKIRWLPEMYPDWCDFTSINECRDYSCTCCVKCVDDKCSPCVETGGECRVECRSDELEDEKNKCLFHQNQDHPEGCKCCKRCEATSECNEAFGKCVTSADNCPPGSFASTGCCGGCYCCKPVYEGVPSITPGIPDGCSDPGSYCSETNECANGYYSCFGQCQQTLWHRGLQRIELGYCCVPKQVGSVNGRSAGLPMPMKQFIGRVQDQFYEMII